jgi:DNA-binding response OmpR family regulator
MPHILVIDDSEMLLALAAGALREAGYHVETATNLAELDRRLSEYAYDLVLVDVRMPEMFGDDVVEFLRKERNLRCKLVLYSDTPENELKRLASSSGADGYILKSAGVTGVVEGVSLHLRPPVAKQPEPSSAPGSRGRILVVDDSETTALLLEGELRSKGFEVHTADTADKATKIILKKKTRPDLVLLDVRMPNVNGEQFCRFIKSNSLFAGIKVLLCSGEDPEELKRICREAGADGYVAKDAILSKVLAGEIG